MTLSALHVSGNKILDANNKVVVLRGVNQIGSGYQCLTSPPGGSDPVWVGPTDSVAINAMKRWGCNCMRIQLNCKCWSNISSPFTGGTSYTGPVKAFVDALNASGIYVILCLTDSPSGGGEMADSNVNTAWTSVATMFASYPGVLFETYNEPNNIVWTTWKSGGTNGGSLGYSAVGQQTLVNTIRAVSGATQPILLDGISFAGDFSGFISNIPTDAQNNLVASWHCYSGAGNPDNDIGNWYAMMSTVAASYPVILSEFGGDSTFDVRKNQAFITRELQFCDSIGAGYLIWAWTGGPPITGVLGDIGPTYYPSDYGVAYYQYLMAVTGGGVQPRSSQNTRLQVLSPAS